MARNIIGKQYSGLSSSSKKDRRSNVIKLTIITIAIGTVAAGAWLAISYVNRVQDVEEVPAATISPALEARTKKIVSINQITTGVSEKASAYLNNGDVNALEKLYEKAIEENADNSIAQVALYVDLSTNLKILKKYEKSLDIDLKAYDLDKDGLYTAALLPSIGYTSYRLGDNTAAIEYLQKMVDYQRGNSELYNDDVIKETEDFIQKIKDGAAL